MSLLDRGPHTLQVWLATKSSDAYGGTTKTYPGPPVTVAGAMVQPLTAAEAYNLGVQADTAYKVICRNWPGGPYTKAVWNGRTLFQRGEATEHSVGRRTRHYSAILVANSAEVK